MKKIDKTELKDHFHDSARRGRCDKCRAHNLAVIDFLDTDDMVLEGLCLECASSGGHFYLHHGRYLVSSWGDE